MKNTKILSPLFTSLLLGSVALAQVGSPTLPDAPQPQDSTSTQIENTTLANKATSDESKLITQARPHPRFPGRPMRPYYGHTYRSGPMPGLSPVGALIGFGVGAALGASRSQDATTNGRVATGLLMGAICALIGGAIGDAAHPFLHARKNHPPSDQDDEDDSDFRSAAVKTHSKQSISASPIAPTQSTRVETIAQASLEEPAVP
jgi:hypothetical protein